LKRLGHRIFLLLKGILVTARKRPNITAPATIIMTMQDTHRVSAIDCLYLVMLVIVYVTAAKNRLSACLPFFYYEYAQALA
jgi:hypothetical protein